MSFDCSSCFEADFSFAKLTRICFDQTNLLDAKFEGAKLSRIDFSSARYFKPSQWTQAASLKQVILSYATDPDIIFENKICNACVIGDPDNRSDFSNGSFKGTDFCGTIFDNIDFSKANFSDADLRGCVFYNCDTSRANFDGADLSQTKFINENSDEQNSNPYPGLKIQTIQNIKTDAEYWDLSNEESVAFKFYDETFNQSVSRQC